MSTAEMSIGDHPVADHPSAETLADHVAGTLDDDASDRLREHLAVCPDCARIVLDLSGVDDDAPEGADPELDDAWDRLDAERAPERSATTRAGWFPLRFAAAAVPLLVAGLLATSLGLVVQQRALRSATDRADAAEARLDTQLSRLQAPQVGVASVTLLPRGALRDGLDAPVGAAPVARPNGDAPAFVAIHLAGIDLVGIDLASATAEPTNGREPRYRVEIRDAAGGELWAGTAAPDERGQIHLLLPSALLPADGERLEIHLRPAHEPSDDEPSPGVVYDLRAAQ